MEKPSRKSADENDKTRKRSVPARQPLLRLFRTPMSCNQPGTHLKRKHAIDINKKKVKLTIKKLKLNDLIGLSTYTGCNNDSFSSTEESQIQLSNSITSQLSQSGNEWTLHVNSVTSEENAPVSPIRSDSHIWKRMSRARLNVKLMSQNKTIVNPNRTLGEVNNVNNIGRKPNKKNKRQKIKSNVI